MDDKTNENQIEGQDSNFDETKRESMITMGKRAAYVTPAVLTLLTSQKASAISMMGGGSYGGSMSYKSYKKPRKYNRK